jgi:hypothetical protein
MAHFHPTRRFTRAALNVGFAPDYGRPCDDEATGFDRSQITRISRARGRAGTPDIKRAAPKPAFIVQMYRPFSARNSTRQY